MSLDVYLTAKEPITKRSTGVFVRVNGKTKELSPDEVLDRWPEAKVVYEQVTTDEIFTSNITHNMVEMARKVDVQLYEALWRPEEKGWGKACDIIPILEAGLKRLVGDRKYYEQFNPKNGWGSYDNLVSFITEYLNACKQYPNAEISVCG